MAVYIGANNSDEIVHRDIDAPDSASTAIANEESRSELAASRRRIVAVADEARRRIERNLRATRSRAASPKRSNSRRTTSRPRPSPTRRSMPRQRVSRCRSRVATRA